MMNSRISWEILIPSVVTRGQQLQKLIGCLEPQIQKYDGDVRVMVHWNNYENEIGVVRQRLAEEAGSHYISFIDDDDLVADDFVDTIYPLLQGVDYIGFKLALYDNGLKSIKPVFHSLDCSGWYDDDKGYYRRGVQTNPVLRELALKGRYDQSKYNTAVMVPEDEIYHKNIDQYLKTEHFIDREMYFKYLTDEHAFLRFHGEAVLPPKPVLPRYFHYHPDSTES